MQNLQITKAGYFIVLFMMVMLLPVNGFSSAQQADNWLDELVTVRFQNEPLSTVLEKVSKQTGIAILYDQELANEKVSGNYKDVKASDAITRLFSGKNKSIQVSNEKKVIVVKTFGAKDFIWAGTNKGQENSSQMTLAELDALHAKQVKVYKERIADDNEIVSDGMTRGEINALHIQQQQQMLERIVDDNEIVSDGMTRGEINALHKQQQQQMLERIADDNEIVSDGMTRGKINALHKQQQQQMLERIADDNEIVSDGMTRDEINQLHKKQLLAANNEAVLLTK